SVFKAMNQTGADNVIKPTFKGGKPVMFVCGDDETRKPVVLGLVAELGFETIDAGGLAVARLLEPYGLLWIHLALRRKLGRDFALGFVRPQTNLCGGGVGVSSLGFIQPGGSYLSGR